MAEATLSAAPASALAPTPIAAPASAPTEKTQPPTQVPAASSLNPDPPATSTAVAPEPTPAPELSTAGPADATTAIAEPAPKTGPEVQTEALESKLEVDPTPTSTAAAPAPAQPTPTPTAPLVPEATVNTATAQSEMSPAQPEPAQAPVAATLAPTAAATTAPVVPSAAPIAAPTEPPATAPTAAAVIPSTVPHTVTETAAAAPSTTAPVAATDKKPSTAATDEKPEPQNPLTERFSEAEWTALKAFRAELPNILAEAYPDKPNAKDTPITLWGVKIDPNVKDARASVVLMKFLRARNLSVRDATDMFVGTLRWRESFNIEAALEEKFPEDIFGQLGHVYGHDKEGRPVVYNLYGANKDLKAVFGDVQRFIRWRVALMERSVALLDFREIDQTIQIHDYEGVSLSSRDANSKSAASEATNIFQSHYPELLYKKFFINVPTLLNWIFWAFKPLISANTLAKMTVVGTGHHALKKALLPHINASDLPERYGGEAKAF